MASATRDNLRGTTADVDDDVDIVDDDGSDDDERRVLAAAPARKTAAAATLVASAQEPIRRSGVAPASTVTPGSSISDALAAALKKVEAQSKLIVALSEAKRSAEAQIATLRNEVDRLSAAATSAAATASAIARMHTEVEDLLALSNAAAAATAPCDPAERGRRLREAVRPVCCFQVIAPAPAGPSTSSVDAIVLSACEERAAMLASQVDKLESALEHSRRENGKLQDLCRDAQRRERERGASEQAMADSKLAQELARVHEVLSESTASWDAKQQELQRLRTLMRFSVLRRENEHLQGVAVRADELEVSLAQQQRVTKEKQYEIDRLERHIERLVAESKERRGPSAELKRLRMLESHVLGIMTAQERDSAFVKGAHNNVAVSAALSSTASENTAGGGPSSRPLSAGYRGPAATAGVPTSVAAAVASGASPRTTSVANATAMLQQYRLKTLIPGHLLAGASVAVATNATPQSTPIVATEVAASRRGDSSSGLPRSSAAAPVLTSSPQPCNAATDRSATGLSHAQPQRLGVSPPTPGHHQSIPAPPPAAAPCAAPPTTESSPPSAVDADDRPPLSDADTPFSVIAARMAKYLAKKEDEKRRKREEEEAAAAAAAAVTTRGTSHKARLINAFSAASAGLPTSSGYVLTRGGIQQQTTGTTAMYSMPGERAADNALKRQYDELRARLTDGQSGGSSRPSASRPSSAPVARRPMSASTRGSHH